MIWISNFQTQLWLSTNNVQNSSFTKFKKTWTMLYHFSTKLVHVPYQEQPPLFEERKLRKSRIFLISRLRQIQSSPTIFLSSKFLERECWIMISSWYITLAKSTHNFKLEEPIGRKFTLLVNTFQRHMWWGAPDFSNYYFTNWKEIMLQ